MLHIAYKQTSVIGLTYLPVTLLYQIILFLKSCIFKTSIEKA